MEKNKIYKLLQGFIYPPLKKWILLGNKNSNTAWEESMCEPG